GTTNLGADDAAGIATILEVVRRSIEQELPHPPLVIVFTVQEEAGMCGAANFDSTTWNVADGIVFDNAYEAGIVVSRGAAYEAFEVREKYKQAIQDAFEQAARLLGGHVKVSFKTHSNGYEIDPEEALLQTYRTVLERRGLTLHMKPTFIGSDTSGFRPTIRAFTIS